MSNTTQSVQKIITFSDTLYRIGLKQAEKKGISFQEYIRHLILIDDDRKTQADYMVSEQTEQHINESVADYKAGKSTTLKTSDDIEKHFKNL